LPLPAGEGFVLDRIKPSYLLPLENEKKIVVPLHKRELPKETLLEILKQAGLRKLL